MGTSAAEVVDRLSAAYGVRSDRELARRLEIGSSTVANWRARDSVPYAQAVTCALDLGYSLDWLLLGRGPERVLWLEEEGARYAAHLIDAREAARPPPEPEPEPPDDPRLVGLVEWLRTWWAIAAETDRAAILGALPRWLRERR